MVQSALGTHFGIRELVFLVQGTAQPPANVSKSILTFVDSMPELVDKLSAAELSTYVASTRTGLLQKPISIEDAQKGLGTSLFTQISENCTRTSQRTAPAHARPPPLRGGLPSAHAWASQRLGTERRPASVLVVEAQAAARRRRSRTLSTHACRDEACARGAAMLRPVEDVRSVKLRTLPRIRSRIIIKLTY